LTPVLMTLIIPWFALMKDPRCFLECRSKVLELQYIESGLFSVFPGFGIHILRVGLDLPLMNRPFAKSKRAAGDSDLIPSTPAVLSGKRAHVTVSPSPKNRT
jgi:hypothetical protein